MPLFDIQKTQEDKPNGVNGAADFLKKEMLVVFPRASDESSPQHGNSRPTQYTLQNRSLPTREQRPGQQVWGQSPSEPINLGGVMPGSGWTQTSPSVQPNCSLDNTTLDTCMSDNTSDGPKSLGHTPSTTNNSSNPSHSPPQDQDPDSTNRTASYQQTPSSSTAELLSWSPSNEVGFSSAHSTSQQQQQHPDDTEFIVPPSWQANSSSELPDTLTGLGSPRDANWSQMLDGVLWDDAVMGGNNMGPWIPR